MTFLGCVIQGKYIIGIVCNANYAICGNSHAIPSCMIGIVYNTNYAIYGNSHAIPSCIIGIVYNTNYAIYWNSHAIPSCIIGIVCYVRQCHMCGIAYEFPQNAYLAVSM